ncbi:hypothetical protein N7491_011021 [Penicillium cf. griseofulvum]|uniref:Uncharacterized protein n=1 Tax=Penicillium cf. griseofulvum TaxID=2972120 RepID=A0A9W9N141_9EURO|nr:hypothetical protein N7472_001340 [Penicillium cf. griseofulvum]KAJ5422576.1 hypothetical protein N7491_011021 [Penicillium cf. griseofulvum]KAJ5428754.1 hypothetical protein N7445_010208 [Penicillium cf. griseofulvum]
MFSAPSLLCIGTWAAVALQATAVPHGPSYYKSIRDNVDACGAVGKFKINPTPVKWNKANTDAWLNKWWTENAQARTDEKFGFAGAFGKYALDDEDWSCQNTGDTNNCRLETCDQDLNKLGNSTEPAYYIARAISNLHGFFLGLEQAFGPTSGISALDTDSIVTNFWNDEHAWDPTGLKEALNLIATVIGLAVVGLSAPALLPAVGTTLPLLAGAGAGLISGGVGAAILGVSYKDPTSITQADLGHLMANILPEISKAFIEGNNELMLGHGYGEGDIRTILEGGSWINYEGLKKAPAQQAMINIIKSMMINSLWRSQRVFILGGGACHDGQDVGQGLNDGDNVWCDEENRAWYLYYWQSGKVQESQETTERRPNGWISRPWGSDRMGKDPILKKEGTDDGAFWPDLDPQDVIKSSLKSYKAAGYSYDSTTSTNRISEIFTSGANTYTEGASMEGVWTIPVCDISKTINNPDYEFPLKDHILRPYGFNELPSWCGPICGMDTNATIEFYKAANFKDRYTKPFLYDCTNSNLDVELAGKAWDWTTNEVTQA